MAGTQIEKWYSIIILIYFTITKCVLFELCCLIVRECCSARFTLKEHQNVIGEEQGTKPVTGVSLRHSGYPSFL